MDYFDARPSKSNAFAHASRILLAACMLLTITATAVAALPTGFEDVLVYSGPDQMVAARFAADGKVFIAEKRGFIDVLDDSNDATPTTFVDLRPGVVSISDLGLLGIAIHPDFPTTPYVYGLYVTDNAGTRSGTLSRWTYNFTTNTAVAGSQIDLITGGWCFAAGDPEDGFASHGIGDLRFGPDGALYVSAGDGASYNTEDYGQFTGIDNCTDPVNEGGALRSQDLETSSDPVNLNGAILRVDPLTGDAFPDNPFFGDADENKARIIAYGLRNPYRFDIDQSDGTLYVSDNGWSLYEEINVIPDAVDATVENFGWPCYEGINKQAGYDALDLPLCEALYSAGTVTQPAIEFPHFGGDPTYSSSGMVVYTGGNYPTEYDNALFFADIAVGFASGSAIRVIPRDEANKVNFSAMQPFAVGALYPVDLSVGPDGNLYYVDLARDQIRRIEYGGPIAIATSDVTLGAVPLTVNFDASTSYDAGGGALTYAWDLDGDSLFDDSTQVAPAFDYTTPGIYTVSLRVTDGDNNTNTATLTINAGATVANQPPLVTILTPSPSFEYIVGQPINYSGEAYDPEGFKLPPSQLNWEILLDHCQYDDAESCHQHIVGFYPGTNGTFIGPDHEFPTYVTMSLVATELPWWNNAWDNRARITIDTTGASQTLTGFPVLVTLTPSNFAYENAKSDGSDLRFIDPTNTQLAYEIESWNTNGTSTIWVRTQTINPQDAINGFWVYYNNPSATDAQNPLAVWNESFEAVYHLSEAGVTALDATGNSNGLVLGAPTSVPGIFGQARSFDGVDDAINTQYTNSLHAGDWSLSLWAQLNDTLECIDGPADDVEGRNLLVKEWNYRIYLKESCKLGAITIRDAADPENANWPSADTQLFELGTPEDRAWHNVVYQYQSELDLVEVYIDGVRVAENVSQTSVQAGSAPFTIGGAGGSNKYFPGLIDEVQIASTARSADWIALAHNAGTSGIATVEAEQARVLVGTPLEAQATQIVNPEIVIVPLSTFPAGLNLTIFGRTITTPFNQEIMRGGSATITAPATQVLAATTYVFSSWSDGGARSHLIVAQPGIEPLQATYTAQAAEPFTIRLNAGGPQYIDGANKTWTPDTAYVTSGSATFTIGSAISGTTDDALYQSERWTGSTSTGLTYAIPVPNGEYNVTLYFAEIYSGTFANGARVFSINLEGAPALANLDIFSEVGANAALAKSFRVNVTDGVLNVQLAHGIENPKISALRVQAIPVITPPPPPPTPSFALRANAGGPLYTDGIGNNWVADTPYVTSGSATFTIGSAISGTTDDALYQSERWTGSTSTGLTYAFPVPNGNYNVTLHFAEIYSGTFANGARVFSINLEGAPALANLDIFSEVGANAALTKTFPVTVTDGVLNVQLAHGIENPKISAIEIVQQANATTPPPPPPQPAFALRINAGGPQYTTLSGDVYNADAGFIGGNTFTTSFPIAGTADDALYQSERWMPNTGSGLQYALNVPNGNYDVVLHFAEIYTGAFAPNARVFNVNLEGATALSNLDIYSEVGERAALQKQFRVTVADGVLNIVLTHGIENPKLSAIEVLSVNESTSEPDHYAHAKPGFDQTIVDIDGDGFASVTMNGEGSHTHAPGQTLASLAWSLNGSVIGTGLTPTLVLPVGVNVITLTVTDTVGSVSADDVTITVLNPTALPGVMAYAYDYSGATLTALPDTSEQSPVWSRQFTFMNAPTTQTVLAANPYKPPTVMTFDALVNAPYSGRYTFQLESVNGAQLYIDDVLVVDRDGLRTLGTTNAPVTLTAGLHTMHVRYFSPSTQLLAVKWNATGSIVSIPTSALFLNYPELLPVIHSVTPAVGPITGGNLVALNGTGFIFNEANTSVSIDGTPLAPSAITAITPTSISFFAPPGSGNVTITVQTPNGVTSAAYEYSEAALPAVTFSAKTLTQLPSGATTIAMGPDEKLYVGSFNGNIYVLTLDENKDVMSTETITTIADLGTYQSTLPYCGGPCVLAQQVLGIAFNPFDDPANPKLYVARSNVYNGGNNIFGGAVSVLSGPNYSTITDVVTGLPTSGHDHGVFGLEFTSDGDLLIQSGGMTNAGIPHPIFDSIQESPLSAATLIAHITRPSFDGAVTYSGTDINMIQTGGFDVEVFASGQRSSYDIVLHSNGNLYAIDNGPNPDYGNESIDCATEGPEPYEQDELNLVREGNYYGSPNRNRANILGQPFECVFHSPSDPTDENNTAPLAVITSSANGIAEYRADTFAGQLRGDLITSTLFPAELLRISLSADGESVQSITQIDPTQGGLDVIVGADGTIYSADYTLRNVYAHVPIESVPANELRITGVAPYRGPIAGGRTLIIAGHNFNPVDGATVLLDGQQCAVTSMTTTKIYCTTPAGSAPGLVDLSVTSGTRSDTMENAYEYL